MPDSQPLQSIPDRQVAGTMLFRIGIALFVIFLTLVLAAILPIKLIEPTWQLRLVGSLVNNAFIALIGLVLINLAPEFSTSERLNRRRLRIANLAVIASIGYLLIVPLQGLAVWQGLSTFNQVQTRQLQGAKEKIELIRKALKESTSTADLQTRLQAIPGPSLPPLDTNRPLAEVRPQLLSILDSAQSQVRQRSVGLSGDRLQRLTQESVRIGVSALVFACAFASGSVWPGSSRNLFDSWIQGFSKVARLLFGGLRPGTRGGGRGRKTANQEYFEQISGSNQDPNR